MCFLVWFHVKEMFRPLWELTQYRPGENMLCYQAPYCSTYGVGRAKPAQQWRGETCQ